MGASEGLPWCQLSRLQTCPRASEGIPPVLGRKRPSGLIRATPPLALQYVDLRTQYSELTTLTSQYIRFITETLRRLEEEEVRDPGWAQHGLAASGWTVGGGGMLPPGWLFLFPDSPLPGSLWPHARAWLCGHHRPAGRLTAVLALPPALSGAASGTPLPAPFSSDLLCSPPLSNSWFLPFGSQAPLPGLARGRLVLVGL